MDRRPTGTNERKPAMTVRVHVVQYPDCRNLTLRWVDPDTGKTKRKAASTSKRKDAEREAAQLEADIESGRAQQTGGNLSREQFRERYELEVVPGLAEKTGLKIGGVFNTVESILPGVAKGRLRDLTPDRLSALQTELRTRGRAESTIAGYLAHLRAALQWAADMGLIAAVPKMKRPQRVKRSSGSTPMKGRPISGEEFERILAKVPAVAIVAGQAKQPDQTRDDAAIVASWERLLWGLWWSGLRMGEALEVYWDRTDRLCVDMTGRRPMLRVPAELEKGHRDRTLAIAPEFAQFLAETPQDQRRGRVFRPLGSKGDVVTAERASQLIAKMGRKAGVMVHTHPTSGKVKHASAHDLRRSFGERWSHRVMPPDLMQLMRHESIQTTMRYYVGRNAQSTADAAWDAFEKSQAGRCGTVSGTIAPEGDNSGAPLSAVTLDHVRR